MAEKQEAANQWLTSHRLSSKLEVTKVQRCVWKDSVLNDGVAFKLSARASTKNMKMKKKFKEKTFFFFYHREGLASLLRYTEMC